MNAEHRQQIFGGEIQDYYSPPVHPSKTNSDFSPIGDTSAELETIYNHQVKSRGPVDTTGIYNNNGIQISGLIERTPDKFQQMLNDTLTQIAREIGLADNEPERTTFSVAPREHTADDIQQAMDNVAKAIEELKSFQQ